MLIRPIKYRIRNEAMFITHTRLLINTNTKKNLEIPTYMYHTYRVRSVGEREREKSETNYALVGLHRYPSCTLCLRAMTS